MLSQWLRYHLDILGFDHFQIYDLDGSMAPYVEPFKDRISYYPRWSDSISPEMFGRIWTDCRYCNEMIAYDHCMMTNRDNSDWVMVLHAPDCYVSPPKKVRQPVEDLLQRVEAIDPPVSSVVLRRHNIGFGPGGLDKRGLLRNRYRARAALDNGMPLVRPAQTVSLNVHNPVHRQGQREGPALDPDTDWRCNHYVDMVEIRSGVREKPTISIEYEDDRMDWAADLLYNSSDSTR